MRRRGWRRWRSDKTWSLFSAWPVTTAAQWFGTPNTEQGYKNIHTRHTTPLLFFFSSSCFSFLFNVNSFVQLSFQFFFQCRTCTFCFLGLIFLRTATYLIMLFVSTNLYHRHVCSLSCFKCVCVLCKVLLALSFHPQDIFYLCSFLFLSIFLVFPHFVWNTLNEVFFPFMLDLHLVFYRSSIGRE